MNFIFNLIRTAFEWALFLALMGGLGEATARMYQEAGSARAHGLVSLSVLNRSLVGETGSVISGTRSSGQGASSRER